ncbi:hypothetical protein PS627_00180 [Pseudomonas fluorescens]|uniref:hypothetical protein n=1 Tax=Pseudomonas fluorescens TaxID=294 RepID=UPI0012574CCC|nr:hypothetical protein [Pseudomonas fluorescens]CAG8863244.1 hypothetical protein PS627_00180 [Pseudomonas fluorescens]
MNSQRAVIWIAFLGTSAVLAWAPGHWFGDAPQEVAAARPAPAGNHVESKPDRPAVARAASSNLFPSQRWSAAPTVTTVTEQPMATVAEAVTPTAPVLPFQFVGRLADRLDQQVFLQNGEKLYVVRQGDVIDDTYRIEQISATELNLVYLPLHLSQTLSVGSAP